MICLTHQMFLTWHITATLFYYILWSESSSLRCLADAIRKNLRRHLDKSERNLRLDLEDAKQ